MFCVDINEVITSNGRGSCCNFLRKIKKNMEASRLGGMTLGEAQKLQFENKVPFMKAGFEIPYL